MDIHWTNIAWTLVTVGCIGYGEAQESVHTKTPIERSVETVIVHTVIKPLDPPAAPVIKITDGPGGNIAAHRRTYSEYQNQGARIELRGGCYSACTLVFAHVDADRICVAPGAFLAFHAAQDGMGPGAQRRQMATTLMAATYPAPILAWIDRHGGPGNLPGPGEGFWVMYDRMLWQLGYAKCP